MIPLTQTESKTLKVIWNWQEKYKNSPTPSEIAQEISKSYNAVCQALYRLEAKGYLCLEHFSRLVIIPLYKE